MGPTILRLVWTRYHDLYRILLWVRYVLARVVGYRHVLLVLHDGVSVSGAVCGVEGVVEDEDCEGGGGGFGEFALLLSLLTFWRLLKRDDC